MTSTEAAEAGEQEPIWARPETRRRSTLSRATIVDAAITLADEEGLAAVSIRRIATELGARAMSLYTYLDSKDDLFDLMADATAADVLLPEPLPLHWRDALTAIARATRKQLSAHPWVVPLMAGGTRRGGPNGMRHVEQSLRALASLNIPAQRQGQILQAVDDYVLGYVTRTPLAPHSHASRAPLLDQPYYRDLLDSDFPLLKALLQAPPTPGDSFEVGLAWILDGIEKDLSSPA